MNKIKEIIGATLIGLSSLWLLVILFLLWSVVNLVELALGVYKSTQTRYPIKPTL